MAKTTKPKKEKSVYKIFLHIGPDEYNAQGESILEALQTIKPKRYLGFGKIDVTTPQGLKSSIPIRLVPIRLERIFKKEVDMQLFAKRIQALI